MASKDSLGAKLGLFSACQFRRMPRKDRSQNTVLQNIPVSQFTVIFCPLKVLNSFKLFDLNDRSHMYLVPIKGWQHTGIKMYNLEISDLDNFVYM